MPFFYWILIWALQIYLIQHKIELKEFLLWNGIALVASAKFLFYRIKKKRVLVSPEMTMAFFIGLNAVVVLVGQMLLFDSLLLLIGSTLITLVSFIVLFKIS